MYLIDTNEGRRVCTRLGRTSKGHNGSARVCTHQHLPYLPDAHPSTNLSQSTQRPQTNFAPNQASTTNNFTLRDLDEEQEMGVYVTELGFRSQEAGGREGWQTRTRGGPVHANQEASKRKT